MMNKKAISRRFDPGERPIEPWGFVAVVEADPGERPIEPW